MDERERHSKGMEVRRAVLGDAHVDRAEAKRNDFNGEFQDLITRHAWGEIWTRPGLTRHTRSLLTIGLMGALWLSRKQAHLSSSLPHKCANNSPRWRGGVTFLASTRAP